MELYGIVWDGVEVGRIIWGVLACRGAWRGDVMQIGRKQNGAELNATKPQ